MTGRWHMALARAQDHAGSIVLLVMFQDVVLHHPCWTTTPSCKSRTGAIFPSALFRCGLSPSLDNLISPQGDRNVGSCYPAAMWVVRHGHLQANPKWANQCKPQCCVPRSPLASQKWVPVGLVEETVALGAGLAAKVVVAAAWWGHVTCHISPSILTSSLK